MNFIYRQLAGIIVIILGFLFAAWLNSDGWMHPSINVMIGVLTGVIASAANEIVTTFVAGVKKGYRGE